MPKAEASDDCTLEIRRGGRVIAKEPTFGYLISAAWSPGNQFVAINNRRANSGDYLWIFRLADGKCLKRPDDALGERLQKAGEAIAEKAPGAGGEMDRGWLGASKWISDNTLSIASDTRYFQGPTVAVVIPVKISGDKLSVGQGKLVSR